MKLSEIYQKLTCEKSWVHSSWSETQITTVLPFSKNMPYEKNVLYICDASELPIDFDVKDLSFLCTNTKNISLENYSSQNFILAVTSGTTELFAQLSGILSEELNYTTSMNHLIFTVTNNKGLQVLLDEAYKILRNPMIIIDNSYKILAMNKEVTSINENFNLQIQLGYLLEENLADIKSAKVYEAMRQTKLPYYSKDPKSGLTWINSLVYVYGIEAAHLGVIETEKKFTPQDQEFIHFLCNLISLELQKNDSYIRNHGIMHNVFLSELLEGIITSPALIDIRSRQLDWQTSGNFCIMTIFDKSHSLFNKKAANISEYLKPIFPNSHWAVYENKIVFLLSLKDKHFEAYLENDSRLMSYLKDNELVASFSTVFKELTSTTNAYRQSLKAFELGEKLAPQMLYHLYINYICHDIGGILSQNVDINNFYNEKVLEIWKYDTAKNSNLLKTLDEYLIHIDDPSTAAKNLFIHRNTLFYRINKMQTLFDINLNNGLERLHIHLSIKFLENL